MYLSPHSALVGLMNPACLNRRRAHRAAPNALASKPASTVQLPVSLTALGLAPVTPPKRDEECPMPLSRNSDCAGSVSIFERLGRAPLYTLAHCSPSSCSQAWGLKLKGLSE